jgi:NADP-dependent 3-hydroxy acid dehydrogenase YdfG
MPASPVILVTGASSGIGAATARLFGGRGFRVVLAARRLDRLQALAEEIVASGGQALPVAADLTQVDDIQHLVDTTLAHYGQIDILVNNAGFGRLNWLDAMDPHKDIAGQIQVNVLAVIWMAQAVLPHMIERRSGHIINMGSMASWVASPTYTIYAASKFALRGFSEALRREVGIYDIRVSVIYPGGVATEFGEHVGYQRKTGLTTPKGLRLSAEQVAEAVWKVSQRPRRGVMLPGIMRLSAWANFFLPGLVDRMMENRFTKPERLG